MLREYRNSRYSSSRFSEYVRDFIVETWERHRLRGIKYDSLLTSILQLHYVASARSLAYVTESASMPIPISLVLDFFFIWLFTIGVVFFPREQPLIIAA